jgi:hypothetical protein
MVSSFGDIDNDGDVDLFVGRPYYMLKVYTNNGYGNFQFDNSIYSMNSEFYPVLLDLNNDGFLDVVIIDRWGKVLYNNGTGGFLGAASLGLFQVQANVGLHGVSWGDPDDDGDLDFFGGYSSNGGIPKNLCYLNNGSGDFEQFDPTSPIVEGECTTPCINWVDYDNDGDMDLYVHNFSCDNKLPSLYENLGDMQFTRHDIIDEMYRHSFANSSVWGDLDNDGDLDLFITVENNEFPWPPHDSSATPFNVLYLNEGNSQFTNVLDHPLTLEDSHTAMLFDHDNDGDLDVLMTRYSWSNDGHNNLFVNEGNDNSWVILTCEGTISNRSAIGTRIYSKTSVYGNHSTQTREITPINGHLSYANLRVHFGLGDADLIDTLHIRWPSGHIDEYLDVKANQFYRAVEDENLEIDFKATNYIQYSPAIADFAITEGESKTLDLKEYYHFIQGDTVPEITGDTLTFSVYNNENPDAVTATIDGNNLILEAGAAGESSTIQVIASAGFTERMDQFIVEVGYSGINDPSSGHNLSVYPNPTSGILDLQFTVYNLQRITIKIYDLHGREVATVVDEVMPAGEHIVNFDTGHLKPGVYIYRKSAVSSQQSAVGKLIIVN